MDATTGPSGREREGAAVVVSRDDDQIRKLTVDNRREVKVEPESERGWKEGRKERRKEGFNYPASKLGLGGSLQLHPHGVPEPRLRLVHRRMGQKTE